MLFVVGGAGRRVVFGVCEPLSEREGERERGREEKKASENVHCTYMCEREGERVKHM